MMTLTLERTPGLFQGQQSSPTTRPAVQPLLQWFVLPRRAINEAASVLPSVCLGSVLSHSGSSPASPSYSQSGSREDRLTVTVPCFPSQTLLWTSRSECGHSFPAMKSPKYVSLSQPVPRPVGDTAWNRASPPQCPLPFHPAAG